MSAPHTLDVRLYETLTGSGLPPAARELVVGLCESAVAIAADLDLPHRGRIARCAVHLLVGHSLPELDPRMRSVLAHLCEVAVVRGL